MIQTETLNFLNYLQSTHTSQKFLEDCYIQNNISDSNRWSYENSYRFLYYLQHGLQFYETAKAAQLVVKPVLLFYGMVHLLKACILTKKPNYPENTSLLAHGVSTRKRKKQQYSFLQDEVKVQHKGLFPYFSKHLFHVEQMPFEKIDMDHLLASIPELNQLFEFHRGEGALLPIGMLHDKKITFPSCLLDNYHMTKEHFIKKMSTHLPVIYDEITNNESIDLMLSKELSPASNGPFYFHLENNAFYLPSKRHYFSVTNEVMNHYLLLYNLSMICRYETEWWGDLLHTLPTEDYPFIKKFLSITANKVPFLLGYYLLKLKKSTTD